MQRLFSVTFKRFSRLRGIAVVTLMTVTLLAVYLSVVTPPKAYATTSNTLNFQARLESSSGAIAPDGTYNVTFHLFNALSSSGSTDTACSTDTNCLWEESYTYNSGAGSSDARIHVANGYMTVNLGSITAFPNTIDWDQQLYLTMDIGGTVGSGTITWDGQMSPRLPLTAVPYAFRAGALASNVNASGYDSNLTLTQPAAGVTTGNENFVVADQGAAGTYDLLTGGSISGATAGVVLQSSSPGTQQSGNFNISGTGLLATLDATGSTLAIGPTNATTITVGNSSTATQTVNIGSVGTTATASTINIGTTSDTTHTQTIKIGSTTQLANSTVISGGGTGGVTIKTGNGGTVSINDTSGGTTTENIGAVTNDSTSTVNINSKTGGASVKTVNIGSTDSSSVTTLQSGTGGLNLNASVNNTTNINTGTSTGTVNIGNNTDTGGVNILANAASQFVTSTGALTLSSAASASWTVSGTNALTLGSGGAGTVNLQAGASGGLINIGNNGVNYSTGNGIQIGQSNLANTASINIGTNANATGTQLVALGTAASTGSTLTLEAGTGAASIQIGNGATAHGIQIGTGAAVETLTLGSTNTTSTTSIQGGASGNINIGSVGSSTLSSTTHIADTSNATGTQKVTIGSTANTANTVTLQAGATTEAVGNSGATIQMSTNSVTAFEVQGANGNDALNVNTTTNNLITNSSFAGNFTGWAATGTGASLTLNTNYQDSSDGSYSLQVVTGTSGAGGAQVTSFTSALTPTQYTLSFFAMASGSGFTDLSVSITGGTSPTCSLNSTTVVTTGFNRYTCTFTSTTSNITAITIGNNTTTSRTFYLDGVDLTATSYAQIYGAQTSLDGSLVIGAGPGPAAATASNTTLTVESPRGASLNDNAFAVLNDTGTNMITANGAVNSTSISGGSTFWGTAATAVSSNGGNGARILAVRNDANTDVLDTTSSTSNLISNPTQIPSTGNGITNWTAKGGSSTLSSDPTNPYIGLASMKAAVTAVSNGMQTSAFNSNILPSTQYQLTFYAECSAADTTFTYGRDDVSGTDINATTTGTCGTTWQQYTWHFTTGATITSPNIFMDTGSGAPTSMNLWIDAVTLVQTTTSAATNYDPGSIYLPGVIAGPVTLQNTTNSTTAFQIQNAGGTTVLNVNTSNNQVTINANGVPLILNETASGKENGILFENTGTPSGEVGISGGTGNIINSSVSGDLALKAASGNILFSASTSNSSNEQMCLTQAGYLGIGTGSTAATTSRLTVPWVSGDSSTTSSFGSTNSSDNQTAITANSYSNNAVNGTSYSSVALNGTSTLSDGVDGYSSSGNGVYGYSTSSSGVTGHSATGIGVFGYSASTGIAVEGGSTSGISGYFQGGSGNSAVTLETQQNGAATTAPLFQAVSSGNNILYDIASNGNVGVGVGLNDTTVRGFATALSVYGAIMQTGMNTVNTSGGTYTNDYQELGYCNITAQYTGCTSTIQIVGGQNGGGEYDTHANVYFSDYQQNAMGTATGDQPSVVVSVSDNTNDISAGDFEAVTTTMTGSQVQVQLWAKITDSYEKWSYGPVDEQNTTGGLVTWTPNDNNGTPQAALPANATNATSSPMAGSYDNATTPTLLLAPLSGPPTIEIDSTNYSEVDGAMYYDSSMNSFRCGTNGSWQSCTGQEFSQTGAISSLITNTSADQTFNYTTGGAIEYTTASGDCQNGVQYIINASGTYNQEGSNDGFILNLYMGSFNMDSITVKGAQLANNSTNAGWSFNAVWTCWNDGTHTLAVSHTATASTELSGNAAAGPSFTSGNYEPWEETNTMSGVPNNNTWTNGGNIALEAHLGGSTSTHLWMDQFSVQRLGP